MASKTSCQFRVGAPELGQNRCRHKRYRLPKFGFVSHGRFFRRFLGVSRCGTWLRSAEVTRPRSDEGYRIRLRKDQLEYRLSREICDEMLVLRLSGEV